MSGKFCFAKSCPGSIWAFSGLLASPKNIAFHDATRCRARLFPSRSDYLNVPSHLNNPCARPPCKDVTGARAREAGVKRDDIPPRSSERCAGRPYPPSTLPLGIYSPSGVTSISLLADGARGRCGSPSFSKVLPFCANVCRPAPRPGNSSPLPTIASSLKGILPRYDNCLSSDTSGLSKDVF